MKHFHGAQPNFWFSHIAVEVPDEDTVNVWLEPVNDKKYDKLNN